MIKFSATTADLKRALSVVALATGDVTSNIQSHALFSIKENKGFLYSTDEDKIASSYFPISDIDIEGDEIEFTADPKRVQTLITNSDSDQIKFTYDPESKTLNIYASDSKDAYVSFASFDPNNFLRLDLSKQELNQVVNANIFLSGIKFILGFLPKDDKDKKFSNLFINNGVMYGSNGHTKIGAFKNDGIADIPNLTLRRQMLSSIVSIIDKTDMSELAVKSSNKLITFSSTDDLYCFGFRKSTIEMPKFPISIDVPELDGLNINRAILLKKLNRLSLASWEDIGIKMVFKDNENLEMETATDRPSYEHLPCKRISGEQSLDFVIECNKFKRVLSLFQASNIDLYVAKTKCTIYSNAEIIIEEEGKEPIKKPFTAIGLLTLARII